MAENVCSSVFESWLFLSWLDSDSSYVLTHSVPCSVESQNSLKIQVSDDFQQYCELLRKNNKKVFYLICFLFAKLTRRVFKDAVVGVFSLLGPLNSAFAMDCRKFDDLRIWEETKMSRCKLREYFNLDKLLKIFFVSFFHEFTVYDCIFMCKNFESLSGITFMLFRWANRYKFCPDYSILITILRNQKPSYFNYCLIENLRFSIHKTFAL